MKRYTIFVDWRNQFGKVAMAPMLFYRFNAIPAKIQAYLYKEIDKGLP